VKPGRADGMAAVVSVHFARSHVSYATGASRRAAFVEDSWRYFFQIILI
jgi:hypothetical protein